MVVNRRDVRIFSELIGKVRQDIGAFNTYPGSVPSGEVLQALTEIEGRLVDILYQSMRVKEE